VRIVGKKHTRKRFSGTAILAIAAPGKTIAIPSEAEREGSMTEGKRQRASSRTSGTLDAPQDGMLSKVPEVTIYFWIIKVLCTTVGETASDYLNVNLGLGLTGTSIAMGVCLLGVLVFQFKARKYIPTPYWLAVVLISIFGTLIADNLTDSLGVPLEASTAVFSVALILTFAIWYIKEGTLSIHSVFTRRREAFYWLAILFTFALGTAAGDLMAEGLGLGYLLTGIIVCAAIAAVTIAWRLKLDPVLAFWIAYILTRPLGASLGDSLSQAEANGGLGFGASITSAVFIVAIIGAINMEFELCRFWNKGGQSSTKTQRWKTWKLGMAEHVGRLKRRKGMYP